ncbi:ABC transporter permease [Rhodospirillaceae bacterium]|nr:ABC transporter permease [Rhodospirillaceae bacterium]
MLRFIINRACQSLAILFFMSFVIYWLLGLMPGDPIDLMVGSNPAISTDDIKRLKELYDLDKPIFERYLNWISNAVQGDLGYSRLFSQPVLDILTPRLLNSLILMSVSLMLALAIAIPTGVYTATHPNSYTEKIINFLCFAGISIPPFWLALLLILLFSVFAGVLPASGMETINDGGLIDRVLHMLLPVATLSFATVAGYTRHVSASMSEVLQNDYIRTARAKGLLEHSIFRKHALKNALLPVVTIIALDFGSLFSGALITETMFSWLGMGKTIYDAIIGSDYNLALVGLLIATALTLAANILADITYAILDPRISYRKIN